MINQSYSIKVSTANQYMWMFVVAGMLQAFIILERSVNIALCIMLRSKISSIKQLALSNLISEFVCYCVRLALSPIVWGMRIAETVYMNIGITVMSILIVFVLSVLADASGGWIALMINTYNAGLGVTLRNEYIQPLTWVEAVLGRLVPIWNMLYWVPRQIILYVVLPSIQFKPQNLIVISGNMAMFSSAAVISTRTTTFRVVECIGWTPPSVEDILLDAAGNGKNHSIPFLRPNLDCIGNNNYLEIDIMTPSIYVRKIIQSVEEILVSGCSAGSSAIAIAIYPLLDFNTYKAMHCFVNLWTNAFLTIPISTYKRCKYGQIPSLQFAVLEQRVMCTPDFTMLLSIFNAFLLALGQAFDNWSNFMLIVLERNYGQIVRCNEKVVRSPFQYLWQQTGRMLESSQVALALSDSLYAITDGMSTVYTSTVSGKVTHAVGNWPFHIDVSSGVAGVLHGWELDADDSENLRTGMLGCRCVDTVVDDVAQIEIICATVPYESMQADEVSSNTSSIVHTVFYPAGAAKYMACSRTQIRVSPLRFSRKRASLAGDDGVDFSYRDSLNSMQSAARGHHKNVADAAVYVQPKCRGAECVGATTCFPFCMGLHMGGQSAQSITLFNAKEWEESVNIAQLDCAGMDDTTSEECDVTGIRSMSEAYQFMTSTCVETPVCTASDFMHSHVPTDRLKTMPGHNMPNSTIDIQKQYWQAVRLQEQPFVVAGDVMLFHVKQPVSQVVVTRLFDNNRGDYMLGNEQLTLASSEHAIPVVYCASARDTGDGESCAAESMHQGRLVLDSASQVVDNVNNRVVYQAAASEWGVHWISNPDSTVIGPKFDRCREQSATLDTYVWSSYAEPRIWTLKTMRLSNMGGPAPQTQHMVSYMLVPGWLQQSTDCDQQVNLKVISLEYINSENILVSVLHTSPANYDYMQERAYDEEYASVLFYYMHPNRHVCGELAESDRLEYTCWRSVDEGMFVSYEPVSSSVVLGTLCPAARRMPNVGLAVAQALVAAVETFRLLLDVVLVVPTALITAGNTQTLYDLRVNRPAFHSVLDTSGTQLMNTDAVFDALDMVALYSIQILVKIADALTSEEAQSTYLSTAVAGTARVALHTSGVRPLTGSMLKHWDTLNSGPNVNILQGVQSNVPGMQSSSGLLTLKRTFSSMTSSMRVNAKVMSRLVVRVLRAPKVLVSITNATHMLASVLYESLDDVKRGLWDRTRDQCLGMALVLGSDSPVAGFFREVCMSVPDSLEAVYNIILVLLVDYPGMACACKNSAGRMPAEVVSQSCLKRQLPVQQRVQLKRIALGIDDDSINMCYLAMDAANFRLMHAFDQFFGRMEQAAILLGQSLDYLTSVMDSDAGMCSNLDSPYVVTLIPEPSDYFMSCSDTTTCRVRCLDTFAAFQEAQATVTVPPQFTHEESTSFESRYFSIDDIENDRHLAPFEIRALAELETDTCRIICVQSPHPLDRCLAIAGMVTDGELAIAYYCVPANVFNYVSKVPGISHPYTQDVLPVYTPLGPGEAVDDVYFLTLGLFTRTPPTRETLLVLVRNYESQYSRLILMQDGGQAVTLVETITQAEATSRFITGDVNPQSMQSIEAVHVIPATDYVDSVVFVLGVAFSRTGSQGHTSAEKKCVRLRVPGWNAQAPLVAVSDCTSHIPSVFKTDHAHTCLTSSCDKVLRLPLIDTATTSVELLQYATDTVDVIERGRLPETVGIAVAKLMRMDKSQSIYRTQLHQTAVNTRHVARNTMSVVFEEDGGPLALIKACVFVSATLGSRETWLQNLCMDITDPDGGSRTSCIDAQVVEQSVGVEVACALHSCVGCQGAQQSSQWQDLQTKCYMASECAIQHCVGTTVNMRRPLCNIGAIAADQLLNLNIVAMGMWDAISHTIVGIVELSEMRRSKLSITWPDDAYTSVVCHAKDQIVHGVSVLTAVLGGIDAQVEEIRYEYFDSSIIDARFHARRVMMITSATSLISSVVMAPVFGMLAIRKTISCRINDTFVAVTNAVDGVTSATSSSSSKGIQVMLGDETVVRRTDAVVGKCLSQVMTEDIRNIDREESSANIATYVGYLMADLYLLNRQSPLEPYVHIADAVISYLIGVVHATQDFLASIDWQNCKPPVAAMTDVSQCVCADQAFSIPEHVRRDGLAQDAFWCTGPLLMTTASGREVLVWNPHSFYDLLHMADYDGFMQCMQSAEVSGCGDARPASVDNVFEQQGVELMQVVTQCRRNYKNKVWDQGVVLFAVISMDEWRYVRLGMQIQDIFRMWNDKDDEYMTFRLQWARVASFVPSTFTMDPVLWTCLRDALLSGRWQHSCMRRHILDQGYTSVDHYFVYEPADAADNSNFIAIDACESFSGSLNRFSNTPASYSPTMWSSFSHNKLPVANSHYKLMSPPDQRAAVAEREIELLFQDISKSLRETVDDTIHDLDVLTMSSEGDEIHQLLDCIFLGPYAAADMHFSFTTGTQTRWSVPQYHRGDPTSRALPSGPETGGSAIRQSVINKVLRSVKEELDAVTRTEATTQLNHIRGQLQNKDNLKCLCEDGARAMRCCDFTSRDQITFPVQGLLDRTWNIGDVVLEGLMSIDTVQEVSRDVWTTAEYVQATPHSLSFEDLAELREMFVFDASRRIRYYSVDEVNSHNTNITVWQHCNNLLSASFFTIPLRNDHSIDVDVFYDPTTVDSDKYLHGMEEVIDRILSRAHRDSPVFWSHAHRYVPSDSVWCENLTDTPSAHDQSDTVFDNSTTWHDLSFEGMHVRNPDATAVQYVRDHACVCGWSIATDTSDTCRIPTCDLVPSPPTDWLLQTQWTRLCSQSNYTSRDDLFLFMEVLMKYSLDTTEECIDIIPSTVWGLLDTKHQLEWYAGQSMSDADVDLQELATNGPGGLRLGLFNGRNSLIQYLKENNLMARVRPSANYRYRHTVAQPYCEENLHTALHANLSTYFRDVFFPMAHSVHEAPAAAMCSRWVVEHAILHAMRWMTLNDTVLASKVLAEQEPVTSTWRRRCHVQLQQLGLCVLRGVFDMVPSDWSQRDTQCPFNVATDHGCSFFYVTENCLVMCDGTVYDPCSCDIADTSDTCEDTVFAKATCAAGKLHDIRTWASEPSVQLFSMQWPETLSAAETGGESESLLELNTHLQHVRKVIAENSIDEASLYADIMQIVSEKTGSIQEGDVPESYCDDVLDYIPAEAQHPVGYHPTCSCLRSATHMRGFVNLMSSLPDTSEAWSVDPVRMRNMSYYSRVFGGAHLTCDAFVYTAEETELNAYHLTTKWDSRESADASMPIRKSDDLSRMQDMYTTGQNPRQSEQEHPLQQTPDSAFLHSVGLIRDWFRCYSDDSDLCDLLAWDSEWPHADMTSRDEYTLADSDEEEVKSCPQPQLRTCMIDNECQGVVQDLVCLIPHSADENTVEVGVCAHKDTCFQHAHCKWPKMCSGEGSCVEPRVYVRNRMNTDVDIQLFASNTTTCNTSSYGVSQHQNIPDFAQQHGLCKYHNWHAYQGHRDTSTGTGLVRQMPRPDDIFMKMQPHECDQQYQHTSLGVCSARDDGLVKGWLGFQETNDQAIQECGPEMNGILCRVQGMRTWQEDSSVALCDLPHKPVVGFLSPYTSGGEDTLRTVPVDVRLCREFEICPVLKFWVDEVSVERRMVQEVVDGSAAPGRARLYTYNDETQCGAAGSLMSNAADLSCTVDRFVSPVVDFIFSSTVMGLAIQEVPPVNARYNRLIPSTLKWSPSVLSERLREIQLHCPRAFGAEEGRIRYTTYLTKLTHAYSPQQAPDIARYADQLVLELFGVAKDARDMQTSGENVRGFVDLDNYMQAAKCAHYLLDGLARVHDYHQLKTPTYTSESIWTAPSPGKSLYMFRGHAPVYVPFAWLWQCVITATADEGGAPNTWYQQITDHAYPLSPVCLNFASTDESDTITIRQQLQQSPRIFTIAEAKGEQTFAEQLASDVVHVLVSGISAMHISTLSDIDCVHTTQPFFGFNLLLSYEDLVKTGRDLANRLELAEEDVDGLVNIQHEALKLILGQQYDSDPQFRETTLDKLVNEGVLDERQDVGEMTPRSQLFIPRLKFKLVQEYLYATIKLMSTNYPDSLGRYVVNSSNDDITHAYNTTTGIDSYARLSDECAQRSESTSYLLNVRATSYLLNVREFLVREESEHVPTSLKYLPVDLAVFFLLRYFEQHIYYTQTFLSGTLHPNEEASVHMYSSLTMTSWKDQHMSTARDYDNFMREKSFECRPDATYQPEQETNQLHSRMRACVSALKVDTGWRVPMAQILQVKVSSDMLLEGFYPAFIAADHTADFLDDLFSEDWAVSRADHREHICYNRDGSPEVMNPYWAGHFDYRTGCDLHTVGDYHNRLHTVDGTCGTGDTCEAEFPVLYDVLNNKMSPQCQMLYLSGEVFATAATWSTKSQYVPLCQRQPIHSTQPCKRQRGTLGHAEEAGDLHIRHGVHHVRGVWALDNTVLRYRNKNADTILAMHVLPTDIGGHSFVFDVTAQGQLRAMCMPLQDTPLVQTCPSVVQSWMHNVEDFWRWQHNHIKAKWPEDGSGQDTQFPSWKCPMKWLAAHGSDAKKWSFAAVTPSPQRNKVRFHGITDQSYYAHPSVHSSEPFGQLRSGWFVTETLVCTDSLRRSGKCRGMPLLKQALKHLREESEWHHVTYLETAACEEKLDWPHTSFRLADHTSVSRPAPDTSCNIYARLPRFAVKWNLRTAPPIVASLPPRSPPWPQPSANHVCRMGRLHRLESQQAPEQVQYCSTDLTETTCDALRVNATHATRVKFTWQRAPAASVPRNVHNIRRRRCSSCEDHTRASFVGRDGKTTLLNHSKSHSQLSVGKPFALNPARMVVSFLRKAVCPQASDAACPALDSLLHTTNESAPEFLHALLRLPTALRNGTVSDDEKLWQRPWVFCDNTPGDNQGCQGTISKQDWLNSSTRRMQCVRTIQESRTVSTPPIQFCKIDAVTEAMCQSVAQWRLVADNIICRASGLTDCPEVGFFYSPSIFSTENQEFTHDTVSRYYQDIDSQQVCATVDTTHRQVDMNEWVVQRCISNQLTPLKIALTWARHLMELFVKMWYLTMQIFTQIMHLLITIVTGAIDDIQAIGQQLVKYVMMLLQTLGTVMSELGDAMFALVFNNGAAERFKMLVAHMCEAINFLHNKIVVGVLCVVIDALLAVFEAVANFLADSLIFKSAAEDVLEWTDKLRTLSFCEENPLQCMTLSDVFTERGPAVLPNPTRCWSVYSTFFGDTSSLACNPGDSCAPTLGVTGVSTDPVMCALCPDAQPNFRKYGCAATTKTCTCSIPILQQTACWSNTECQDPYANCRYVNTRFEPAAGSIACASCQSKRVCLLEQGKMSGFCACALMDASFSTCAADRLGAAVLPGWDDLCLFTQSSVLATSSVYRVRYEDMLSVACSSLKTQPLCVRVEDQGYFLLGYEQISRRRLLHEEGPHHTLSALCSDVLARSDMPAMHTACMQAYSSSVRTLHDLRLSTVMKPCALCSVEDILESIKLHPKHALLLAMDPWKTATIVVRHSPVRHIATAIGNARETMQVFNLELQGLVSDFEHNNNESAVPPLVPHLVHALWKVEESRSRRRRETRTSSNDSVWLPPRPRQAAPRRTLLSVDYVVESLDDAFTKLMMTHEAYSSRIQTGWRYNYPDLVSLPDGSMPWVQDSWPPVFTETTDTCDTLGHTVAIMQHAINVTAIYYTQAVQPPTFALTDPWVRLHDSGYTTRTRTGDDWLSTQAARLSRQLLAVIGVTPEVLYNLVNSVVREVRQAVMCDFEAVQTCSRWHMRLPHGMVIVAVCMGIVILLCMYGGLPMVAFGISSLYIPCVLYVCYGYSPLCAPMIPSCLMRDVIQALQQYVPDFIILPDSLLRPGCRMDDHFIFLTDSCLVQCHESPFEFDHWFSVVAWYVAEMGGDAASWSVTAVKHIPFINRQALAKQIMEKYAVYKHGGNSLVMGHRICAVVSSYHVVPYLAACYVLAAAAFGLAIELIYLVVAWARVQGTLFVVMATD